MRIIAMIALIACATPGCKSDEAKCKDAIKAANAAWRDYKDAENAHGDNLREIVNKKQDEIQQMYAQRSTLSEWRSKADSVKAFKLVTDPRKGAVKLQAESAILEAERNISIARRFEEHATDEQKQMLDDQIAKTDKAIAALKKLITKNAKEAALKAAAPPLELETSRLHYRINLVHDTAIKKANTEINVVREALAKDNANVEEVESKLARLERVLSQLDRGQVSDVLEVIKSEDTPHTVTVREVTNRIPKVCEKS